MEPFRYAELLNMFRTAMSLRETCFECGDSLDNHEPNCRVAQVLA